MVAVTGFLDELSRLWVYRAYQVHPLVMLAAPDALARRRRSYWIFGRLKNPGLWSGYLNVFALILIAPAGQQRGAWPGSANRAADHSSARGAPARRRGPARLPDIYYIILDAYARSDVMKELFDFDNEPFLERLEQKGFFVARRSRSNYCQTTLSLCSSLNCDYLDKMIDPRTRDTRAPDRPDPRQPRRQVAAAPRLQVRGVRDRLRSHRVSRGGSLPRPAPSGGQLPDDVGPHDAAPVHLPFKAEAWDFYTSIRERILFVLDQSAGDRRPRRSRRSRSPTSSARTIPSSSARTARMSAPERSRAAGNRSRACSTAPGTTATDYRKQAIFLTKRIEQTIDRILAQSPEPPIIILQSDHGSGLRHHLNDLEKTDLRERMSILNCYYFPDRNYKGLTEGITPVNSFRVVFNNNFGAKLSLLNENNLYSTYEQSFECY